MGLTGFRRSHKVQSVRDERMENAGPEVEKLMDRHDLEANWIEPSGEDGQLLISDVLNFLRESKGLDIEAPDTTGVSESSGSPGESFGSEEDENTDDVDGSHGDDNELESEEEPHESFPLSAEELLDRNLDNLRDTVQKIADPELLRDAKEIAERVGANEALSDRLSELSSGDGLSDRSKKGSDEG